MDEYNYGTNFGGTSVQSWLFGMMIREGIRKLSVGEQTASDGTIQIPSRRGPLRWSEKVIYKAVLGNEELLTWQNSKPFHGYGAVFSKMSCVGQKTNFWLI